MGWRPSTTVSMESVVREESAAAKKRSTLQGAARGDNHTVVPRVTPEAGEEEGGGRKCMASSHGIMSPCLESKAKSDMFSSRHSNETERSRHSLCHLVQEKTYFRQT